MRKRKREIKHVISKEGSHAQAPKCDLTCKRTRENESERKRDRENHLKTHKGRRTYGKLCVKAAAASQRTG